MSSGSILAKLKTIHDSGADPVDFLKGMATVNGSHLCPNSVCISYKVQDTTFFHTTPSQAGGI